MGNIDEQAFKKKLEEAMRTIEEDDHRSTDEIYREGVMDMRRTIRFLYIWAKNCPKGSRSAQKALTLIKGIDAIEADVMEEVISMGVIHERKIVKQLAKGNSGYCPHCCRDTAIENINSPFARCLECGNEIKGEAVK